MRAATPAVGIDPANLAAGPAARNRGRSTCRGLLPSAGGSRAR